MTYKHLKTHIFSYKACKKDVLQDIARNATKINDRDHEFNTNPEKSAGITHIFIWNVFFLQGKYQGHERFFFNLSQNVNWR